MTSAYLPRRIGRVAFSLGSLAAFLPAAVAGGYEAWRAFDAISADFALNLTDALAGNDADMGGRMPTMLAVGQPSWFVVLLGMLGWAAFGWLAAGRSRDIGDPPVLGLAAVVPALLCLAPQGLGPAGWLVGAAVTAWSVRLGFVRGVPPVRKIGGKQIRAGMPRR